jgi:hypothetical protein
MPQDGGQTGLELAVAVKRVAGETEVEGVGGGDGGGAANIGGGV